MSPKLRKLDTRKKILLVSVLIGAAMILIGVLIGDTAVMSNMVIIALIVSITPYFIYKYSRFMRVKSIETQFPGFIRDLADSNRSGMSLTESIRVASKTDYGKLSAEIGTMKNKLSWGFSFIRVLELFQEKLKDSKLIYESMNIIMESYNSGGKIAETLEAVSQDVLMIKEAEAEKTSMVKQHVMLMYGIFYMFLGIALMIIFVMVPMITNTPNIQNTQGTSGVGGFSGPMGMSFSNPCGEGGSVFPCGLYNGVCALLSIKIGVSCYYISLFFVIVIIQGLFSGLIAGQLGENSVIAGGKHSMIMVFSALGLFLFVAKMGLFPS